MTNMPKQRIIVIALVALAVTTAINIYNVHRQQKAQAETAKMQELSRKLLDKLALKLKLNTAEKQLMNGNYDEALPVIREMADSGNVRAQHDLGWAYRQGLGVDQDYVQALSWFTKAAQAGQDPDSYSASYYVGEIYYKGLGTVEADRDKAIKWLKLAREHGVKEAAQYLDETGS